MYLDPGFGSMLIQVLVAFIAACAAYIVMFKKKIFTYFSRGEKKDETIINNSDQDKVIEDNRI